MTSKLIRFDWAIKNILRNKENFGILEGFLSEILKEDLTIIEILESESNKEEAFQKVNRVDLLAKDKSDHLIIIEVQVNNEYDYMSRMLFEVSRTVSERLMAGSPYQDVKKVYMISIVYFDLGHGEDYVYHGTTNFRGLHKNDILELNPKQEEIYMTRDVFKVFPEYYILKVENFDNNTKDGLDEWIYFLKNESIKNNFKAKGLKEAEEKLNVLKMTESERQRYNKYLDELHYEASMVASSHLAGKAEGRKEGIKEGRKEGLKEGRKEGLLEGEKIGREAGTRNMALHIAKNMLTKGLDINTIAELTGLTINEIKDKDL